MRTPKLSDKYYGYKNNKINKKQNQKCQKKELKNL